MSTLGTKKKKFDIDTYPVQMTVSFPRMLRDMVRKEAERLDISKTEFVRRCLIDYALKHEPYKSQLERKTK